MVFSRPLGLQVAGRLLLVEHGIFSCARVPLLSLLISKFSLVMVTPVIRLHSGGTSLMVLLLTSITFLKPRCPNTATL